MSYCTTTNAHDWNPKRTYNTTTQPTLAQMTSFVNRAYAEMNAMMVGVGITVPIATSPVSVFNSELRRLNSIRAAAYLETAAFMGGNKQDSTHDEMLNDLFEKGMQNILDHPFLFAPGSGSASSVADSYELSNPDEARETDDEPFARDKDF